MKKFLLIVPALLSILNAFDAKAYCDNECREKNDKYTIVKHDERCDCRSKCDCEKKAKCECDEKCDSQCDCEKKNNKNYEKYWVQYSEDNSLFFRYLTASLNKKCPTIIVDKNKIQTFERHHTLNESFPLKICQAEIDNIQNHKIQFKDLNISTKVSQIDKISIIGDTGCITWDGKLEQKCNVLSEYPFSEIARNVAKNEADLVVHVGDYFYSKSKCVKEKECFGRPYGDKLDTWKVDFLDDAEVFFKKKPILFTRGNHEKCLRGGDGWSVILDYSRDFRKCSTYTKPHSTEFEKFRFLVVDSAEAEDSLIKFKKINKDEQKEQLKSYISQFNELARFIKNDKENILVIHRPVLSKEVRPWERELKKHDINYVLNYAIQHSDFKKVFPQIKMILSGHTHTGMFFELKNKNHSLYQIVSGNSGAFLNNTTMVTRNKKIFDYKIKDQEQYKGFGFSELFLKNDKTEKIKFYDYWGKEKFEKVIK